MNEKSDMAHIKSNPFAALFPSVSHAEQFTVSKELGQSIDRETEQYSTDVMEESSLTEDSIHDLAQEKMRTSSLLEQIFLFTIDNDCSVDDERPSRCILLEELASACDGQTWMDIDCLEQAVFERLLLENPASYVISTSSTGETNTQADSLAGETEVFRYLYQCYTRLCRVLGKPKIKATGTSSLAEKCQSVILLNARTCLQQPGLYVGQDLHQQFINLFMEEFYCVMGDTSNVMLDFFDKVVAEIDKNREDGSLSQVFGPVLNIVTSRFKKDFSIMHSEVNRYLNLIMFFTRRQSQAEMLLEYNDPADWGNGKSYQGTLFGSILSLSCIPASDAGPHEFFNNPSSSSKQEHDIAEANIWPPLSAISERVYEIFMALIKLSPEVRHKMLMWIGKCIQANMGRTKIWASHMPHLLNMYCSDGFALNFCQVVLKFCKPFLDPRSPKLLKIQPTYSAVVVADDKQAAEMNVHAKDLSKETCLVPSEDTEKLPTLQSYNFITECFYLAQQALALGFHMIHDKFVKLNQDLHRIQTLYQDMRGQSPNEEVEPLRTIKKQMEKGMTMFLSMKAALSEPTMLELMLNAHLATSTWLCQMAINDQTSRFDTISFPLPESVPSVLSVIPEFTMGNITDFTLYIHRFKNDIFEMAGDKLSYFMDLILVYMGSPQRMRNPHLRAELANTLSALMPPSNNPDNRQARQGIVSKFHREQLFLRHPLIENLPEKLIHVFVSIEMTGQSVAFEQKFNYRRPMYIVLEYLWEIEIHRTAIKKLAKEAEEKIEDHNAPLFLQFINLLINDAIFLLDEALSYMSQIKEKQQERDQGSWNQIQQRQRQENENTLRQLGMLARYHNMMANYTIHSLELLTREIKTIFCHSAMVDRIASMLNYFLLHLVGPKQKNFKVKDKNEFEFKPDVIVSDITDIYLNLGRSKEFCVAVTGDGRSYSQELFTKAITVLQKISKPPIKISSFLAFQEKLKSIGKKQLEEEEMFANAPEEFLDPIMGTLMRDPVTLPTSGIVIDRAVIARHILSDQTDPFNRKPLAMDMVEPNTELKEKIEKWMKDR